MRCSQCQTDIPEGANFCPACGSKLPEPEGQKSLVEPEPEQPSKPKLKATFAQRWLAGLLLWGAILIAPLLIYNWAWESGFLDERALTLISGVFFLYPLHTVFALGVTVFVLGFTWGVITRKGGWDTALRWMTNAMKVLAVVAAFAFVGLLAVFVWRGLAG